MWDMSISQGGTPKACGTITTITNSRMEVGDDHHGFHVRISQREERKWRDMDHRRSVDEIRIILAYKDDRLGWQVCQDLHKRGGTTPWDSGVHCIGSRSQVHLSTLAEHTTCLGDKIGHEHYVSPLNGWPISKSHPSLGRSITGMCARI